MYILYSLQVYQFDQHTNMIKIGLYSILMISEKVKVGLRLNQYRPTSNELFNGSCLNHNNR